MTNDFPTPKFLLEQLRQAHALLTIHPSTSKTSVVNQFPQKTGNTSPLNPFQPTAQAKEYRLENSKVITCDGKDLCDCSCHHPRGLTSILFGQKKLEAKTLDNYAQLDHRTFMKTKLANSKTLCF